MYGPLIWGSACMGISLAFARLVGEAASANSTLLSPWTPGRTYPMSYQLVAATGAKLQCPMGSIESRLVASNALTMKVENKLLATIYDSKTIKNIPPFRVCTITGGPCMPLLSTSWLGSIGMVLGVNTPMLPADSKLPCAAGGVITITDANQSTVWIATVPQPQARPASNDDNDDDDGGGGLFGGIALPLPIPKIGLPDLGDVLRGAGKAVPKIASKAAWPLTVVEPFVFPETLDDGTVRRAESGQGPRNGQDPNVPTKVPKRKVRGKEGATDVPKWVKDAGYRPYRREKDGKEFAERVMDDVEGKGNYDRGPGSDFDKLRKWGDRKFENPKPPKK